jgi:hypothetical protein
MTMTLEAALITGITAMGGVVVWLALWVRKMNNERIKESKETKEMMLQTQHVLVAIVEKNTEGFHGMKASIERNTVATQNGAEQMRGATDRLTNAVDNLNRDIRNNKSDR